MTNPSSFQFTFPEASGGMGPWTAFYFVPGWRLAGQGTIRRWNTSPINEPALRQQRRALQLVDVLLAQLIVSLTAISVSEKLQNASHQLVTGPLIHVSRARVLITSFGYC